VWVPHLTFNTIAETVPGASQIMDQQGITHEYERIPYIIVFNEKAVFKDTYGGQYGQVTLDGGGSWLNSNWLYRKHLRIDSSRVAGNLTNFPVLINSTDLDWRDSSNSGHVAQSDGGDILFTAGDGVTKLDHEIEKYDPATGELVAWVEVSSLSGSADTGLYIYYGNSSLAEGNNQWNAVKFRLAQSEIFHLDGPIAK